MFLHLMEYYCKNLKIPAPGSRKSKHGRKGLQASFNKDFPKINNRNKPF